MEPSADMNTVYKISPNVISKKLEGQVMIVPLVSNVGNLEDDLFQLNETGTLVWELLDGKNRLRDIVDILSKSYDVPCHIIEKDTLELVKQLIEKNLISEAA